MTGQFAARLDEKNRLIVPAKLREELGNTFYVTISANGKHKCLAVFTAADWQTLSDNFSRLPLSKRSGAASLIFHKAVECTPDKQFRFSLGQPLMAYAGIDREVVITGKAGQAEIWDAAEYERFEREYLSPEQLLASMEEIGL